MRTIHHKGTVGEENIKKQLDNLFAFLFNDAINPINIIIA